MRLKLSCSTGLFVVFVHKNDFFLFFCLYCFFYLFFHAARQDSRTFIKLAALTRKRWRKKEGTETHQGRTKPCLRTWLRKRQSRKTALSQHPLPEADATGSMPLPLRSS